MNWILFALGFILWGMSGEPGSEWLFYTGLFIIVISFMGDNND